MANKETAISALSNLTRLNLIKCLGDKEKTVTDLVQSCGLSQSAVSQHLSKLRNSGLLAVIKRGRFCYYFVKYPDLIDVVNKLIILNHEVKI